MTDQTPAQLEQVRERLHVVFLRSDKTLDELEAAVGLSQSWLSEVLRNRGRIKLDLLHEILAFLGVSQSGFFQSIYQPERYYTDPVERDRDELLGKVCRKPKSVPEIAAEARMSVEELKELLVVLGTPISSDQRRLILRAVRVVADRRQKDCA